MRKEVHSTYLLNLTYNVWNWLTLRVEGESLPAVEQTCLARSIQTEGITLGKYYNNSYYNNSNESYNSDIVLLPQ